MIPSEPSEDVISRLQAKGQHGHLTSQMSGLGSDGHLDSGIGGNEAPGYLAVARVLAPWGIRGEVKAEILTDFPNRFSLLEIVYLGEDLEPVELESTRLHKRFALLKFAELNRREDVDRLRGMLVQIRADQAMPLDEDTYYVHQIEGLEVWTSDGEHLGPVIEVLFTGGNDVYVVKTKEQELLIPAISDVVREVDLEAGRLTVRLLEGLR
jgi:16S rRNA processing protein RimM